MLPVNEVPILIMSFVILVFCFRQGLFPAECKALVC